MLTWCIRRGLRSYHKVANQTVEPWLAILTTYTSAKFNGKKIDSLNCCTGQAWTRRCFSSNAEDPKDSECVDGLQIDRETDGNLAKTVLEDDALSVQRTVGKTPEIQTHLGLLKPDSPPGSRLLKVAVIGRPNCGKSTLTNALMGWRVSSVSGKVHTTRKNTLAVYTQDEVQIVFLDTPGILEIGSRKKHKLEKSMELDPITSLASADLVCAMVDASIPQCLSEMDIRLMELLYLYRHIPAVLCLNKIDKVKKSANVLQAIRLLADKDWRRNAQRAKRRERLFAAADKKLKPRQGNSELQVPDVPLELAVGDPPPSPLSWEEFMSARQKAKHLLTGRRGWPLFKEVFRLSATRGDGVNSLKDYLLSHAKPSEWAYHSCLVTDQEVPDMVVQCVREKLLDLLKHEVPYQLGLDLVLLQEDPEDHLLNVVINVICWSDRQLTIFLGRDGEMIRNVSSQAKQAMMDTFRCDVRLKLVAINRGVRK